MNKSSHAPETRKAKPTFVEEYKQIFAEFESELAAENIPDQIPELPADVSRIGSPEKWVYCKIRPNANIIPPVTDDRGNVLRAEQRLGALEQLPKDEANAAHERWQEVRGIRAAHYPFHPGETHTPAGQKQLPGARIALNLRRRLENLYSRLQRHFDGQEGQLQEQLRRLRLVNPQNREPAMHKDRIIAIFSKDLEVFKSTREWPQALEKKRQALERALEESKLSRVEAVKKMHMSRDTLDDFLSRRIKPRTVTMDKIRKFTAEYLPRRKRV